MPIRYNEHIYWGDRELFVVWEGYTPPHVPGGHVNEVMLLPTPPGDVPKGPTSALQAGPIPRKRIALDCVAEEEQEYKGMQQDWFDQAERILTMHDGTEKTMVIKELGEPTYTYYNLIHYTVTFIEVDEEEEEGEEE